MKNKKYIFGVIIILIIISSFFWGGNKDKENEEFITEPIAETTTEFVTNESTEASTEEGTQVTTEVRSQEDIINVSEGTTAEVTTLEIVEATNKDIAPKEAEKTECTLSIDCGTVFDNLDKLDEGKKEILPSDGIILSPTAVSFTEGETVFDILLRVTRDNSIHFEYSSTPAYNTAYVEGINNLYEFDCGELSGWTYRVNGEFPGYGCSQYVLKKGDVVEWLYTCDLGRDVGNEYVGG